MSDVKVLRLINGMEVIGGEKYNDAGSIILSNPLIVHTIPQGPNQFGVAVQPYSLVGKTAEVEFSLSHVISVVEAEGETANQYRASQAGIVLAGQESPKPQGERRLTLVD